MANEQNLIGMAFTNTSPLVVPTRSKDLALGTNPIAFFAGKNDLQLDMATSTVALGKIEMKRRLGQECPYGWGVDDKGQVSTYNGMGLVRWLKFCVECCLGRI